MNTYGIGLDPTNLERPFYIVENGVRLPMQFLTAQGACYQVDLLKLFPLTRDEILETVAAHIVETRHGA